ncbi:MAG TPA: Gfo/Idh/MocA family oxidoreductase [Actinobacteria bacterium]|nr:Gfo/Idh/MocA family oxidoreductase [Actinomycetota bacterium]
MILKVAVFGCGAVARDQHLPCLADLPGVEFVAVCDRNPERAAKLAKLYGVPRSFADPGELLESCEVDFVDIVTPPESHRVLAEQALGAGCHALIEKPFVYSVEDADAVLDAAAAAGRHISVIHNDLFTPGIDELHRRVAAGEIGEVCAVHFFEGRRDQRFVPDPWYFRTFGGRLGETLPHALYQLTEFFDDLEVEHVAVRHLGHMVPPEGVEPGTLGSDELHVVLQSGAGNAMATLSYSLNANVPKSLLVCGTRGTLTAFPYGSVSPHLGKAPDLRQLIRRFPADWSRALARVWQRRFARPSRIERLRQGAHYRQLHEFVEALMAGRAPRVSGSIARDVVRLWEAIAPRIDAAGSA